MKQGFFLSTVGFALAPIYVRPECKKALRMGTLATQARFQVSCLCHCIVPKHHYFDSVSCLWFKCSEAKIVLLDVVTDV